jgi:hypothetical protein
MSAGKTIDTERLVSNLLETYLAPPDWTEKRTEIRSHKFVSLRRDGVNDRNEPLCTTWYKVLFTTSDTVVVQQAELTGGETRFQVEGIPLAEWDARVEEWIDEDHDRYEDVRSAWAEGMGMYGADV